MLVLRYWDIMMMPVSAFVRCHAQYQDDNKKFPKSIYIHSFILLISSFWTR